MKVAVHGDGLLHVETPLGIVNIRAGLSDRRGRRVDSIEVIPSNSSGERKVVRRGFANTRLLELLTVKVR
jgi:hypothetical protein